MLAAKPQPRPGPFTWDEYMAWEAEQEEKWELVDGYAVPRSARWDFDPATGMAGATQAHNLAVANLLTAIAPRLRGGSCRALPSDIKTRVPSGGGRYPDVTVQCGGIELASLLSSEPRVLFEVLSKSNTLRQQMRLLADYQAVPTVQQIVFLEQHRPTLISWTRSTDGWSLQELEGLDAVLDLPSLGVVLPLAEIYDGFPFADAASP